MAAIRKTTSSKAKVAAAKATTQKITPVTAVPAAPAAVKPIVTAPAKPAIPATRATSPAPAQVVVKPAPKSISQAEWRSMVEQAAYYIAEKNGFAGNPEEHWAAAEAQVRGELTARNVKVV